MDDHEVEQILRTGLERRSAEADVTAPVVDRVRAAVAGRRRTRWSVGVAAAAVLVVVGGVAVATRGGDAEQQPVVDQGTTTDAGPDRVDEWRTEYWGPVAVDVPADWGYGSAPGAADPMLVCAPGNAPGYVGRPIAITDVCVYLRSGWQPTDPYVWLGAAAEPGTYEWDNGYVQETVEVAGTTVTVGTDDPALRERILGTVRPGDLCEPLLDAPPSGRIELTREGMGTPRPGMLCAYRQEKTGGFRLSYGAAVKGETIAVSAEAALRATTFPQRGCVSQEFVVVSGAFDDPFGGGPASQRHVLVFMPGCDYVDIGTYRRLTEAAVEPWANDGVRAVLSYFIGPQG